MCKIANREQRIEILRELLKYMYIHGALILDTVCIIYSVHVHIQYCIHA